MLIPLKDENPLRWIGFPYVTVAFIAICVLAFLWQQSMEFTETKAIYALSAIPAVATGEKALISNATATAPFHRRWSSAA